MILEFSNYVKEKGGLKSMQTKSANQARLKILVVDDERHAVELLERTLAQEFEVLGANSGEQGLALIESNPDVAVVISDQRMPGLSGIDFLVKAAEKAPNAIRIIVSAFAEPDELLDAINSARVHRYVVKPVSPARFIETVRAAIKDHQIVATILASLKSPDPRPPRG